MKKALLLTSILLLVSPEVKSAATDYVCDVILRSSKYGCKNRASSNSMGGSYPLLYDAFNTNPASLPINKTPFGLEYSNSGEASNFSFIKGQTNWGTGFSLKDTNSTFLGPTENYKVALKEAGVKINEDSDKKALDSFYNLGLGINLLNTRYLALPVGFSYRYNRNKKAWAPTLGIGLKTKNVTVGFSRYKEDPKNVPEDENIEDHEILTTTVGFRFGNFLFDYTRFRQKSEIKYVFTDSDLGTPDAFTSKYEVETMLYSLAYIYKNLTFTLAYRDQEDSREDEPVEAQAFDYLGDHYQKTHLLYGISYKFFREIFSLGYYYNYQLTKDSTLVAQLFIAM